MANLAFVFAEGLINSQIGIDEFESPSRTHGDTSPAVSADISSNMNHCHNNLFQSLNSLLCGSLIFQPLEQVSMDADEKTKPSVMYIVLMIVAIACVIYGVYGWVTGSW